MHTLGYIIAGVVGYSGIAAAITGGVLAATGAIWDARFVTRVGLTAGAYGIAAVLLACAFSPAA